MAKKFSAATSKVTADFTDPTIVYLMGVENSGTPASFKATAFDVVRTGLTAAWSGTGTATTPLLVNVTADPGPAAAASKLLDLQVAGSSRASISKNAILQLVGSSGSALVRFGSDTGGIGQIGANNLSFYNNAGTELLRIDGDNQQIVAFATNGITFGSSTYLNRDAADTLAQRNGLTAQKLSIYNTYSGGGVDYERFVIDWKGTTNTLRIGTERGGTGVARAVSIVTGGTERIGVSTSAITMALPLSIPSHGVSAAGINTNHTWIKTRLDSMFAFTSGTDPAGTADTAIVRSAANILGITNGSTGGGALEFTRMTAPATPAADKARIFARDNGSGKTQVCIILPDGVVTVLATQT